MKRTICQTSVEFMESEECAVFINQQITWAGCKFGDFFVTIGFYHSKFLPQDLDIIFTAVRHEKYNYGILLQKFKRKPILRNFAEPKNGDNRMFCGALHWKVSYSIVIYGCQVLSHFLESHGRYLVSCRLHFLFFWNNSRKTGQTSWKCRSFDCQPFHHLEFIGDIKFQRKTGSNSPPKRQQRPYVKLYSSRQTNKMRQI